jgi:hypothetical protein
MFHALISTQNGDESVSCSSHLYPKGKGSWYTTDGGFGGHKNYSGCNDEKEYHDASNSSS